MMYVDLIVIQSDQSLYLSLYNQNASENMYNLYWPTLCPIRLFLVLITIQLQYL